MVPWFAAAFGSTQRVTGCKEAISSRTILPHNLPIIIGETIGSFV